MRDYNQIMSVTMAQRKLLDILNVMQEDDSTITMTKNGVAVGVLMTAHHYEALQETLEILADRKMLSVLAESAKDFEAGRIFSDSEVWDGQ